MSPIESSLRRALARGDIRDPLFRRQVYEAALRAHRKLTEDRGLAEDAETAQHEQLIAAIATIEAEHQADHGDAGDVLSAKPAAAESLDVPRSGGDADDGSSAERGSDPAASSPELRGGSASAPPETRSARVDAVEARGEPLVAAPAVLPRSRPEESRRKYPKLFLTALVAGLAALLVLGFVYFAFIAVDPPSGAASGTDSGGEASETSQAAVQDGWINVFSGEDLQAITTPGGGRVVAVTSPDKASAVRIEGPQDAEGVEIVISMGPGLTDRLAGHLVRGEVTVGTPDEKPRDFGVRCLFGEESACGRQRFTAALASESFVFDMNVPEEPGVTAGFALDPGLGEDGRDLDLYSIRVRILD